MILSVHKTPTGNKLLLLFTLSDALTQKDPVEITDSSFLSRERGGRSPEPGPEHALALASSRHQRPPQPQREHGQSASPRASGADTESVQHGAQELQDRLSSTPTAASRSSSSRDMAATKAELLAPEPLACGPPPLSPLDGYSKLEELQMLLQNAAAGGPLLAAEAAGLLSGDPAECLGEERPVLVLGFGVCLGN